MVSLGRKEIRTGFWWGNMTERDNLGDHDVDGRIIFKLSLKKEN
jgi:hypothetical protein